MIDKILHFACKGMKNFFTIERKTSNFLSLSVNPNWRLRLLKGAVLYSIIETSAFPCRVSACQRTVGKGFRELCPRGFSSSTGFPDSSHCGWLCDEMAACQERLYAEDVPRDYRSKSVTCLSPQWACEPRAKACHAFGQPTYLSPSSALRTQKIKC